jgi:hypothetical protein
VDPIDDAGALTERPLGAIEKSLLGSRKVDRVLRDAQPLKSETCSRAPLRVFCEQDGHRNFKIKR